MSAKEFLFCILKYKDNLQNRILVFIRFYVLSRNWNKVPEYLCLLDFMFSAGTGTRFHQSASKHGRRTFLYGTMRELVCNGQRWTRPALRQLLSYKVSSESISSNSLVNTMEMTVAIQYILTAAQSLGSQDCYKKSRLTILGLADVLFCENEQPQTKWIVVCSEENTYLDAKGS